MQIIDTHLHLVYPERFAYPWLEGAPALNKPFRLEAYRSEAEKLGIEAALHMEVDVAETDMAAETEFVLGLDGPIIGAIAACRPENDDFPAYLERMAARSAVKGLRRILHTSPDALSQSPGFAANLRRLAAHHLTFDLCVLARQLPVGRALAKSCPDTVFVLDHCGVPDIAGKALDPWRADLKAIAELPNVMVKLSGIVAYAGPDWTPADLEPFVAHVVDCFGFDRIVWGSDAPVLTLTADLRRWVEATHQLLAGCSADETRRVLRENARRIYRL